MTEEEGDRKRLLVYSALAVIMTGAALSHGLLFGRNELAMDVLIPFSYLGLGMMIKYGDQAYDAGAYPKRTALLLSLPGGVWLGSLMAVDPGSATIFLGLLIGLLLAGKLDNLAFGIGAVTAVAITALALLAGASTFSLVGSLVVLVFAFIDERTNDLPWVDEGRGFKAAVLHNRPFLKAAVLALCLAGILPSILYFFAFMAFDLAYSVVEVLSLRRGVPSVG
jgi:hypothetical protein